MRGKGERAGGSGGGGGGGLVETARQQHVGIFAAERVCAEGSWARAAAP